ncbi:MAG TPA: translation initiation factor IF-2 subunit beta [Nitrosopumilaceae archaeon]|nr:translation initiation factor IF-2 subunit beta [Nitrosopumilaceae archaeon]
MAKSEYEKLLKKIQDKISENKKDSVSRFELPIVDIMWQGNRTFFRNFAEFPKILRRDPDKVLQYLSKEFASPAQTAGDKAIFVGKKDPHDFTALFARYVKEYLECPTCKSPDTRVEKSNRMTFLICEACGAKSSLKGQYA